MTRNAAYTRIESAPPASTLPATGRALVEEFNELRLRYNRANLEAVRFANDDPAEQQARNADAEAVATATRKGQQLDEPNAHLLAHIARRNELNAQAEALKAAYDQASRELSTWAVEHADEISAHAAEKLENARSSYLAIIPDVEKVAGAYHRARGLVTWAKQLTDHNSIVSYVEHSGGVTSAITADATQHTTTRHRTVLSGF